MKGERLLAPVAINKVADRPEIIGASSSSSQEAIVARAAIGAGNNCPTGAVPMFHQSLLQPGRGRVVAHCPNIAGTKGRYSFKDVGLPPKIGARNHRPGRSTIWGRPGAG